MGPEPGGPPRTEHKSLPTGGGGEEVGAGSTRWCRHWPGEVLPAPPLGSMSYLCRKRRNLYIPGASPALPLAQPEHPQGQSWSLDWGPRGLGWALWTLPSSLPAPIPGAWPPSTEGTPHKPVYYLAEHRRPCPSLVCPSSPRHPLCCCSCLSQPCRRAGLSYPRIEPGILGWGSP